jgi:glycine/D-amino acid oxidase-like deaminating enzyme
VHEPASGLLAYLGCNGRGVALATAMGQQLARRLTGGKTTAIDMPVTAIRPIRFHAAWPVAVRSAVLVGRLRDRLGL